MPRRIVSFLVVPCFFLSIASTAGLTRTTPLPPHECGTERWHIKIGSDQKAKSVKLTDIRDSSIRQMSGWKNPFLGHSTHDDPDKPVRNMTHEGRVYRIKGYLLQYRLENDRDYHLVVADEEENTLIVEIPDPDCVPDSSPFKKGITAARVALDERFNVKKAPQDAHERVVVEGVGFFDFKHGQIGVAPNGIEIHPVLKINFQ